MNIRGKALMVYILIRQKCRSGDCVQHGWMMLPAKSYSLRILALCGITHYAYVSHNLDTITIVGPKKAIKEVTDTCNCATANPVTVGQINRLKAAFGMGTSQTKADEMCTRFDQVMAATLLSAMFSRAKQDPFAPGCFVVQLLAFVWLFWRRCFLSHAFTAAFTHLLFL